MVQQIAYEALTHLRALPWQSGRHHSPVVLGPVAAKDDSCLFGVCVHQYAELGWPRVLKGIPAYRPACRSAELLTTLEVAPIPAREC